MFKNQKFKNLKNISNQRLLFVTIKPDILAENSDSPPKKIHKSIQIIKESEINQSIKEDTQDFQRPKTLTGKQYHGTDPMP